MAAMSEVLIVEDDELIATSLARALRAAGYEVHVAGTVAAAAPFTDTADLVLCDLGLPDGDGLDLIMRISTSRPELPIIAVTARADEVDVVAGLLSGAVDYVVKPFRLAELQARIAVHLRTAALAAPAPGDTITVGDLTVDCLARRVWLDAREVALRPKEFDLLERLARSPGTVVRREQLMHDVWDEHWWGSTKTLDVHMNAIRRKLGEAPGEASRITAVRGVGYRLDQD